MLDHNSNAPPELTNGRNGAWNNEVDLFALLGVLAKHRRMILRNVAVAGIFFLAVGLLWPPSYVARATLLPPDGNQRESFLNLLSDSPLVPFALPLAQSSSELFVEILASRSVGEGVLRYPLMLENGASTREDSSRMTLEEGGARQTTLMRHWEIESEEKALKRLYECTTLATTEQGIIEIVVEMNSPQLAAAVANAFVAQLDRVNREKNISAARNTRVYVEEQLALTSNKLSALADSLAQFQKQHGAVGMNEQMQAALTQAGELQGNLIAKRIELEMMRRSMKADNPAIAHAQAEIVALEKQVQRLQSGGAETQRSFLAFAEIPDLARRLAELTRELKVQETVWQLLNQQFYQAKIQEARDTPTVQVLDRAVPPEFRAKPKRLILLLTGTCAVLLLSLVFAFIKEYVSHVRTNEQERAKWGSLFARGESASKRTNEPS